MNRELKFRIWDNKNKTFIYDWDASLKRLAISLAGLVYHGGYDDVLPENDYVIQQYTGLKDSKGNDIYEGDIVEIGDRKREVIFNIGMFYIDENYGDIVPISEVDNIIKVIGNIFENPELLKI